MTFCGSLIVGATLLVTSASPVSSKSELDKLQGVWRAVAIKIEGRQVEPYELSKKGFGIELNVTGDRFHFAGIGADFDGQLKIENVGKSKRMVFVREDGRRTTSVYRWEDGRLALMGMDAKPPAKDDKEPDVWVFKRQNP